MAWAQDAGLMAWLGRSRLDSITRMARTIEPHEAHKQALLGQLRATMGGAFAKLPALLAEVGWGR